MHILFLCLLFSAETVTAGAHDSETYRFLADKRLRDPLLTIGAAWQKKTGSEITFTFVNGAKLSRTLQKEKNRFAGIIWMNDENKPVLKQKSFSHEAVVAWGYPAYQPVRAAALQEKKTIHDFIDFLGGPVGHRLWSESPAGFTIVPNRSTASQEWVAEHRTKHTYPMTAMRMLAECGGIRKGLCIDIGCGPGHLEVELAKRSAFRIIGLDINGALKPLFEKRMKQAGLSERVSFVKADAQMLPFPDNFADVIVSRGTLIFIPDIPRCLREISRVLKPSGVAFLGGRYLYTPQKHKISIEKLKKLVTASKVPGARVIDSMGQWVKIIGPEAPASAHASRTGPHLLAGRFVSKYHLHKGSCLLICGQDGGLQQSLQRGFVELTEMKIIALYATEKTTAQAAQRIKAEPHSDRISCCTGTMTALPFDANSFDCVASVGPALIFEKNKQKALQEIHRVLRPGGAALVGGRFLGMPASRKVSTEQLRAIVQQSGIPSIRVFDERGQWVEVRKRR